MIIKEKLIYLWENARIFNIILVVASSYWKTVSIFEIAKEILIETKN